MNILMINSVCGVKSTGRICTDVASELEADGHEVKIAYGRETVPDCYQRYAVKIGNQFDNYFHFFKSWMFDAHGLGSKLATKKFLRWADEYDPDLLWLHNIHGYYIHYPLLFEWIKSRPHMKVRWTLHDCWAFTGHCSGCDKWKTGCKNCPQPKKYPSRFLIDRSERNYRLKKACFTSVKNLTLLTPSQWLASLVKNSFLSEYPVEVRYNTVDREIFRPTEGDFRKKYHLIGKKIILGVASPWDERKGFDDFIRLSKMLDEEDCIVLVGLTENQCKNLPSNVIGLTRTNNVRQLAEIYTAADVFVNPTYEDNFPTTNLEAAACGTPVITYRTGGSPESTREENVVDCGDVEGLRKRIQEIR